MGVFLVVSVSILGKLTVTAAKAAGAYLSHQLAHMCKSAIGIGPSIVHKSTRNHVWLPLSDALVCFLDTYEEQV